LSKVYQLNISSCDKNIKYRHNYETFDKNIDSIFEILIKLKINLRMTYKDNDQFDGLLKKKIESFLYSFNF